MKFIKNPERLEALKDELQNIADSFEMIVQLEEGEHEIDVYNKCQDLINLLEDIQKGDYLTD